MTKASHRARVFINERVGWCIHIKRGNTLDIGTSRKTVNKMSDDVTKKPLGPRWRKFLLLSAVPVMLATALSFASPAAAATLNLNGTGPGIQSISSYPNNAMWVNTPTEYNVVPQAGGGGPIPEQVVSSTTSQQTVITPVYGNVAYQGQTWVNSGYYGTGQTWVSSGYYTTGQTWVNSGYFITFTWWAATGYWQVGWYWVNSGYWATGWSPGYEQWDFGPDAMGYWVPGHSYQYWVSTSGWQYYSYWVSTAHWASDQHWISTAHWQYYSYWVNTSHWQSYQYWVDTSHYQSYTYWVDTSHYQSYTYYVWQVVGYSTSVVPVVTKITDSNINLSNESLLGVQPEIKNTTTGQIIDSSFCTTPTTLLIAPTSSAFPDYSGSPWQYANFFSGQDICNINPGIMPTTTFDQWAVDQQSVQLVLVPSWTATVSYNKVTTVNGTVTSSVPVTKVETITGTPYTGPTMPTKYIVGVVCAVQNGQSYCPGSSGN